MKGFPPPSKVTLFLLMSGVKVILPFLLAIIPFESITRLTSVLGFPVTLKSPSVPLEGHEFDVKLEQSIALDSGCILTIPDRSHESDRLLYVAMTRAKDNLLVFGAGKLNEDSWFVKIKQGLKRLESLENKNGKISYGVDFKYIKKDEKESKKEIENTRDFIIQKQKEESVFEYPEEPNEEAKEGTAIHSLLAKLSVEKKENRTLFIQNYFRDLSHLFSNKKQKKWNDIFEQILSPKYDFIFDEKSLTEVDIITSFGELLRPDKICFIKNEIWIIDYKTDQNTAIIPDNYKNQLKKYKKYVGYIYPDQNIKMYIFWLNSMKMQEVVL